LNIEDPLLKKENEFKYSEHSILAKNSLV